jgi:ABC-type branched-subunit amino acid transport system substrate-binding protein
MFKKLVLFLMVVMMVSSLAACQTEVDEESAQGVSDTEVLIANCAATSGAFAPVGVPFIAGIQAYLDQVNAAGGIDGRTIRFLHEDDEFDPIKGKACVTKMVEDEQVFAMVGHFGTPVVGATLEDLKDYGIPSVYFATGIGQLYNDKAEGRDRGIMPVQPIYVTEGQIMVARAVGFFNAEKIGIIYTNDDAGKDLYNGAKLKAEELGIELVEAQVAPGADDVSSAVTLIKEANVDFIIGGAIQATIPVIIKELASQSVNKDVITTYVNVSPTIAQAVLADIEGKFDVYGNGWVSFEGERAQALEEYAAALPEFAANPYAMTGWIAAHFFVEGLRRLEEGEVVTWTKYLDAMESAPINNPFGGSIDFGNGQRAGTQEMNLSKMNADTAAFPTNWEVVDGLRSMDELLGN